MEYEIGDIVPVPLYIGSSHNKPVRLPARIIEIYPKGSLGTMYLCETLKSHFRTCIVVPPPPKSQPDPVQDRDKVQRWSKNTHHNALEVEPTTTPKERRFEDVCKLYEPFLEHIGLDPTRKRSLAQLRSLAHYRNYDYGKIEKGEYEWL